MEAPPAVYESDLVYERQRPERFFAHRARLHWGAATQKMPRCVTHRAVRVDQHSAQGRWFLLRLVIEPRANYLKMHQPMDVF